MDFAGWCRAFFAAHAAFEEETVDLGVGWVHDSKFDVQYSKFRKYRTPNIEC